MIPKIIHYCWFGGKQLPEESRRYIEGWEELNPDFEIIEWNESNFPMELWLYSREAAYMRNWAFVSDVCRLYALMKFGGIYLDTDIELLKPLTPLLCNKTFVGYEGKSIGTAVIGSVPNVKWIRTFLKFYKNKHFINCFGKPVRTPNPKLYHQYIEAQLPSHEKPIYYPHYYFYPTFIEPNKPDITSETVAIHHFAASWRQKRSFADRLAIMKEGFRIRYLNH